MSKRREIHLKDVKESDIPDICSACDLIKIGVYSRTPEVSILRKYNVGPKCKVIGDSTYVFTKADVVEWLKFHGRLIP